MNQNDRNAASFIGSMQDWSLLVSRLIDHAALNHGQREVVSLTVEGPVVRSNWAQVHHRSKKLAQALERLGANRHDRIATLAWNTHRHVECWFGIASMGCVTHTINPRLFHEQLVYIATHAEDRILLFDLSFLPIVETIAPRLTSVEHFICMTDRAHMPDSALDLLCYEDLLEAEDGAYVWPELDERDPAGLCYTSGTTGNPKGVLYSHRSTILHAFGAAQMDALAISTQSALLPIAPMFHANAWGTPHVAAMVGAKFVLNGPHFDPATLHRLIIDEGVTMTAAVPTIWLGMLQFLKQKGERLGLLERVVIGGAAAPRAMIEAFERDYGVTVAHAWGMTEMSPIGTVGSLCSRMAAAPIDQQLDYKAKQGRSLFGVELKLIDDDGNMLPRDGKSAGHLHVRGAWTVQRYFGGEKSATDAEGWFETGDVATIDEGGYLQLTDRSKDVIKSGGEWISSIAVENAAIGCAGIAEAAVVGIEHPKWGERPLMIAVREPGAVVDKDMLLDHLAAHIARWWMPDDIIFVDSLPHTATGKLLKTALREQYRNYTLPNAEAAQ